MKKSLYRKLGWLAGFFGVGTFLMVAWVLFQMLHPADLGKFDDFRVDTTNGEVKAGDLVWYEAHACEPAKYKADVFRTLSTNTIPPEVTLSAGTRFEDHLLCRNVILIPSEAPTGEYRLTITVEYHINPFQSRTVSYVSQPFRVVNDNEEFNILQDAVRNEKELQNGQPQSPPTPTTPIEPTSPVQPNTITPRQETPNTDTKEPEQNMLQNIIDFILPGDQFIKETTDVL